MSKNRTVIATVVSTLAATAAMTIVFLITQLLLKWIPAPIELIDYIDVGYVGGLLASAYYIPKLICEKVFKSSPRIGSSICLAAATIWLLSHIVVYFATAENIYIGYEFLCFVAGIVIGVKLWYSVTFKKAKESTDL